MDDVSGSGPIELFGGQPEFGGAGFGIARGDRFPNLAQLLAKIRADDLIAVSADLILTETFVRAGRVWHLFLLLT